MMRFFGAPAVMLCTFALIEFCRFRNWHREYSVRTIVLLLVNDVLGVSLAFPALLFAFRFFLSNNFAQLAFSCLLS